MDKKKIAIAVTKLILLILFFLWGAWGNQNARIYEAELEEANKKITELQAVECRDQELEAKVAELQKALQVKEQQLQAVQKKAQLTMEEQLAKVAELQSKIAALEKENNLLQAQKTHAASQQNDGEVITALKGQIDDLVKANDTLARKLAAVKEADSRNTESVVENGEQSEQKETTGKDDEKIAFLKAQIFGLERIVTEKDMSIEELSDALDMAMVNRDVLLDKINEQKDLIEEIALENNILNQEKVDLNKKLAECLEKQESEQKAE